MCWPKGCNSADTLAAYDAAIHDGVDILSVSLGNPPPQREYTKDANAIGAFRAMQKGILTVLSGGNTGPFLGSVTNGSPWALTVGASTIDRRMSTDLSLGNNITYKVLKSIIKLNILNDLQSCMLDQSYDSCILHPQAYSGSISLRDSTPWLELILGESAAINKSIATNAR